LGVRVLPHHLTITGAFALALCLLMSLGTAGPTQAEAGENFKAGEVIVKLDPDTGATIKQINADYDTTTLDNSLGEMGVYLLQTPANEDVTTFAERLMGDPLGGDPLGTLDRVLYAEPNFVAEAPEDPAVDDGRHRAYDVSDHRRPSDPDAAAENLKNLNLSCASTLSQGKGSTVAVLDTGAQLDHPALKANFRGVERYDFVGKDRRPYDKRVGLNGAGGHGTHVAGIVDQVAPAAKIMPLRVLNSKGFGNVFTIAKAIDYAQRKGADVINLSLGTSSESKLLKDMVGEATDNGVVVAAAAGNSNSSDPHYPAASRDIELDPLADGLLAVTSVKGFVKSEWANYGFWVDIAAPGEDIRSAFPVDIYANWSGTSMATPFISGQAALIHTVDPSLDPAGIETKIRSTARNIDAANDRRYWFKLGAGHADVCASLQD
jgi:thermitase